MDLDEFEVRMCRITSVGHGQLVELLLEFVRERGVTRIGYHHLPPLGAPDAKTVRMFIDGFEPELLDLYMAGRSAGTTPVATYVRQNAEPAYWDEFETLRALTACEKHHLAVLREAGATHGLSLQVFGPNGRDGLFALGLGSDLSRLEQDIFQAVRAACQSTHLRYCDLLRPSLGKAPGLSPRETEVLGWIARGKSNSDIAQILGISVHTVDAHLRRIYLKLGVFDRISASLRGLGFGLIQTAV